MKNWERARGPIKWDQVQSRYSNAFLTPKDYWLHFKHILHRKFYTRVAQRLQDTTCRCCGKGREKIEHFGECEAVAPLRAWLASLTDEYSWEEPTTFLLGSHPRAHPASGGAQLWLLLWGAIIRNLVRMSTEGDPFNPDSIKTQTLRRFTERATALSYQATIIRDQNIGRGKQAPTSYPKLSRLIAPLGEVGEDTNIHWSEPFKEALKAAKIEHLIKEGAEGTPTNNSESKPNRELIKFVKSKTRKTA